MIRRVRQASRAVWSALRAAGDAVAPGVTTAQVADAAARSLEMSGAEALFLGHGGFPAKVCVSVDEEVGHAVPGDRVLLAGDLVKVDVGARRSGWCSDGAWTFVAGGRHRDADRQRLYEAGLEAYRAAIAAPKVWGPVSAVGRAVEEVATRAGVAVVRRMTGHGIGQKLHEFPPVPNYYDPQADGWQFRPGCAVAVEPILSLGSGQVLKLGWTIRTQDGAPSVHFEETLVPGEYRFFPESWGDAWYNHPQSAGG